MIPKFIQIATQGRTATNLVTHAAEQFWDCEYNYQIHNFILNFNFQEKKEGKRRKKKEDKEKKVIKMKEKIEKNHAIIVHLFQE